jgi:hypothetical protein
MTSPARVIDFPAPSGAAMTSQGHVLLELLGGGHVPFYRWAARIAGTGAGGLFLSYLVDRTLENIRTQHEDDCWVEAPVEDITAETGLSAFEQQAARRSLQESGHLACATHGAPSKQLYRIDLRLIMRDLESGSTRGDFA